jgi:magnesium-transporting ATPase (P-type)
MDALIEDLESQDGHIDDDEEEEVQPGGGRVVPEDMLMTDTRVGLTESEVLARRKKYGLNQMKEEKENLILKFFGFFIGPIQFVMEVSIQSIPMLLPSFIHARVFSRTPARRNFACEFLALPTVACSSDPLFGK